MFFRLTSFELGLMVFAVVLGTTLVGVVAGRRMREQSETLREPFGALQAALLGLVALILAFGLTMAVGRYDTRRAAVVDDANAIGTAYLRAQTLREPVRSRSLSLLTSYADTSIRLSKAVPGSASARRAIVDGGRLQRQLWRFAGEALAGSPTGSATRLYVDSLNAMIDMQTVRVSALANRVPQAVLVIEIVGAAVALGLLAMYLAILERGVFTVFLAAAMVSLLLLITFDLDRPTRGSRDGPRRTACVAAGIDGAPPSRRGTQRAVARTPSRTRGYRRNGDSVALPGTTRRSEPAPTRRVGLDFHRIRLCMSASTGCSGISLPLSFTRPLRRPGSGTLTPPRQRRIPSSRHAGKRAESPLLL
jgi:hypothetical protein